MEVPEGAVAERVTVRTQCRGLQVRVEDPSGKRADDSLEACRAADGAWEL
jgi:hypothetical protein